MDIVGSLGLSAGMRNLRLVWDKMRSPLHTAPERGGAVRTACVTTPHSSLAQADSIATIPCLLEKLCLRYGVLAWILFAW